MPQQPLLPAARHKSRPAFHQPANSRDGLVHRAADRRRHRLHHAPRRGISAGRSAHRRRHHAISGSFRANRVRHGCGADRAEVQRNGVVTRKNSPDILLVVFMLSPDDTFDQLYISNYALLQVRDQLLRLDGIGDIQIFGARDYSMRLWLDPDQIANLGMTAGDVIAAIRAQNLQITGGQLGAPPIADRAFQPNLTFTGRLKNPQQFEDIVIKAGADGRTVRLRDVARIELGALDYSTN